MVLQYGWLGLFAGLLVFLFPGVAWAYALGEGLDLPRRVGLALILAFTLAPAVSFVGNLLFGLPIRVSTIVMVSVTVGVIGLAVRFRRAIAALLTV